MIDTLLWAAAMAVTGTGLVDSCRRITDRERQADTATLLFCLLFAVSLAMATFWFLYSLGWV